MLIFPTREYFAVNIGTQMTTWSDVFLHPVIAFITSLILSDAMGYAAILKS